MENIEVIKELTPHLTDMLNRSNDGVIEYSVECGTVIGFGLFHNDVVAVQRAFASFGSLFSRHEHAEHEILIVISGHMVVIYDDETKVSLNSGESVNIPPNTPHRVDVLDDTWMIGVTVPASEGYPDA